VNAGGPADQQLGGTLQTEFLDLLGSKTRCPNLGNPYRKTAGEGDLGELRRPLVDHPKIPVEREPVYCHDIESLQRALAGEVGDEQRIDRRNTAQYTRQTRHLCRNRVAGQKRHSGEAFPVGIELEIPMRFVVRLVPQHYSFDHAAVIPSVCE
jgi:hypothetical protein